MHPLAPPVIQCLRAPPPGVVFGLRPLPSKIDSDVQDRAKHHFRKTLPHNELEAVRELLIVAEEGVRRITVDED
jgi:hypothetical protein